MTVVHQLAVAGPDVVHARCGRRWRIRDGYAPGRGLRGVPEPVTGWHRDVTCPACLAPPSWAAAGLPSKFPPAR